MKQTTIFDFVSKFANKNGEISFENKIKNLAQKTNKDLSNNYEQLKKVKIQENLHKFFIEEREFEKILFKLGSSWDKNKDSFGYTDENRIMIFTNLIEFKNSFFNVYNFKEFKLIRDFSLTIYKQNVKEKKFILINESEYDSCYLNKAFDVLGADLKVYQHIDLKLLFLRNKKFGFLLCPLI